MSDDIAIAMYPVDGPFNVNIIISVPLDITGFHCTDAQLVPHGSGTFQLPPIVSSGMLSTKHNASVINLRHISVVYFIWSVKNILTIRYCLICKVDWLLCGVLIFVVVRHISVISDLTLGKE